MTIGFKNVGLHRYFHTCQIDTLRVNERASCERAIRIAGIEPSFFNVIKLDDACEKISLLDYEDFFGQAFPILQNSWAVDLVRSTYRFRTYKESLNPPILHRKELLLPSEHSHHDAYCALTTAAEQIGLFEDPTRIGFKLAWESLLNQRGYKVVGHELVPIGNDELQDQSADRAAVTGIARHLTALSRYRLSAPVQTLARFGFLDGSKSVFDYGCGRGDDIRGLQDNNIPVGGWDPYYAPDQERKRAHIVNLGFVINVIEDLEERIDALKCAFELADEMLVVSAMLANQEAVRGTPYGDGVLTSRNTFQKYYTQMELRQFIADTLHEEALPVGPGVFYVFKDKNVEQRFMYGRLENRRTVLRLARLSRPERIRRQERVARPDRAQAKYNLHRDLLEDLWKTCLSLARDPDREELTNLPEIIAAFGSLSSALRFIKSHKEHVETILDAARRSRINDLHVYFAQLQFEMRKRYRHLEPGLQRDIKTFFGSYDEAVAEGKALLFSLGNIDAIDHACRTAADHGIGWLEEGESLQLHTSLVEQLPPILRAYISCGTVLYGDVSSADVIKIHIHSGKLSLMKYDDFIGRPLPRMLQRVKLNLRRQVFDVFDYGGAYLAPYLYRKSRFINEEFPNYAEQVTFEEALDELAMFDLDGYGPPAEELDSELQSKRYQIEGFQLTRSKTVPPLDAPCGQYLKYRDLVECGETQANIGLANVPKEAGSYTALLDLALHVLDPIIEYFGMIRLTYGFCTAELARHIKSRIAPKLDQHAAQELNRLGKSICDRGGAAVDFLVEDENMVEVAKWVGENIAFDRMYVYGPNRPIHISYGPDPVRQVTFMVPSAKSNSRMPKSIPLDRLQKAAWPGLA